ncbi:MAG: FoF1 ATP synthase subunit gamma [Pseudorhodobacter sp.]|nr:FoF1 ATP synthase subunit gamma [Pseudorhodobacter sp.]
MTERLADVSARIDGIRQLAAVVNAMQGIAAARAHTARSQIEAVNSYTATIAAAMSTALAPDEASGRGGSIGAGHTGLLVFCAEQGFAGAFSERVLDSIGDELEKASLFLIGTRGLSIATARHFAPIWAAPMPSHPPGIPKLADTITKAIYRSVHEGRINRLDTIYTGWTKGRPQVVRKPLFPVDLSDFPASATENPLTQLPLNTLIAGLSADYFHALVCKAALHALGAENEARAEAMSAASSQIARDLDLLQATLRRVRQEAITAEIIELGSATSHGAR